MTVFQSFIEVVIRSGLLHIQHVASEYWCTKAHTHTLNISNISWNNIDGKHQQRGACLILLVCLTIPPSCNFLCQTATELIIHSVSSPWWPDLPHWDAARLLIWGDWDICRIPVSIISSCESTADIFFWLIISKANMNVAHSHTCGCYREHEMQETTVPSHVNAQAVYFGSAIVSRGICFQDTDAGSTFF